MTSRNKQLFIDALHGAGTGSIDHSMQLQQAGLARFTGHQHRDEWQWNVARIEQYSEDELLALYVGVKQSLEKRT